MMASLTDSIFATVSYADIFDFPLTQKEVRYWLIGAGSGRLSLSPRLQTVTMQSEQFVILEGRKALVLQRLKKKRIAQAKWKRAIRVARLYRWIPSIMLVGVTGGLAMENAKKDDDIDLFFITAPHTLWVSRFFVTVMTQIFAVRRAPNAVQVADSICLNMFMSQSALTLTKAEQDLFAAHEVLQMRPLWQRGNVYRSFLLANRWVNAYLPTAWADKNTSKMIIKNETQPLLFSLLRMCLVALEPWARVFQLWYMHKRRTTEVVGRDVLRFHPHDARLWVKKKYALRLKVANVPLDRIFYRG